MFNQGIPHSSNYCLDASAVWDVEGGYYYSQLKVIESKLIATKQKGIFEVTHRLICLTSALKIAEELRALDYLVEVIKEQGGSYLVTIIACTAIDKAKLQEYCR